MDFFLFVSLFDSCSLLATDKPTEAEISMFREGAKTNPSPGEPTIPILQLQIETTNVANQIVQINEQKVTTI